MPSRRRFLAWGVVGLTSGSVSACSVQVIADPEVRTGSSGDPIRASWLGKNGLLADPAAFTMRPDVTLTLDRLLSAKYLGVEYQTPDLAMARAMLSELDLPPSWWTKLAIVTGTAAEQPPHSCQGDHCADDAVTAGVLARLFDWSDGETWDGGAARPQPVCPDRQESLDDAYLWVACGRPAEVDAAILDDALASLEAEDRYLADAHGLWKAAAVARGRAPAEARVLRMTKDSLAQDHVQGIFIGDADVWGDLMTTWALLHLSGGNCGDIDKAALLDAVRAVGDSGGADMRLLANACHVLTDSEPPFGVEPKSVALEDPEGPYNPFIVMAARDTGRAQTVQFGIPKSRAEGDGAALASWLITSRLSTDLVVAATDDEIDFLEDALASSVSARQQLLYATALAAADAMTSEVSIKEGAEGVSWLVAQDEVLDIPDLRASLLYTVYNMWMGRE